IFDGAGGKEVSHFAANHFAEALENQCHLTKEEYEKQPNSVVSLRERFLRDNFDFFPSPEIIIYYNAKEGGLAIKYPSPERVQTLYDSLDECFVPKNYVEKDQTGQYERNPRGRTPMWYVEQADQLFISTFRAGGTGEWALNCGNVT